MDTPTQADDFLDQLTLPLDEATAAAAAAGTGGTRRSLAAPSASTPEALHAGQVTRTHRLVWVVFAIVTLLLAALPSFGGDSAVKLVFVVALVAGLGATTWLWWITGADGRFSDARALPAWLVIVVTAGSAVAFFGVFSPAPVAFAVVVYFMSQAHELRAGLTVYVACASIQGGLAALVITGSLADPGLITAGGLQRLEQVLVQVLVQAVFVVAFVAARGSRQAVVRTVASLGHAMRAAAHREAMMLAARRDLEAALRVGEPGRFTDQVVGSYRLGVVIGHGSMGEVYEGTHVDTGNAAAVKLLRRDASGRTEPVRRFLREARTAAALDVPNVVRVFEAGDETAPVPFIAMERLRGQDLAQLLRDRGRLPPTEVVELIRQVARGVDAAHRAGIVHRDLKPQNLFLHRAKGSAPCWKILDFGVSKLHGDNGTLTGAALLGTPAYMAPEQAGGLAVDGCADIHALGVIAFRGLTGELPYRGNGTPELLYSIVHVAPLRASQLVNGLPEHIDGVFEVALAKEPAVRHASATGFADALATALAGVTGAGAAWE